MAAVVIYLDVYLPSMQSVPSNTTQIVSSTTTLQTYRHEIAEMYSSFAFNTQSFVDVREI